MRRWIALLVLIVPSSVYSATLATSWTSVANLPRRFERNVGQAPPSALYISHGMGRGDVALGERSVVFSFPAADGCSREHVEMMLLRSRPVHPIPEGPLDTKTSYFFGKQPDRWRSGVPNYERVRYPELYRGTDLVVYGRESAVEYDFVVAPQRDPSAITLGFKGIRRLTIDDHGDLLLITASGQLRQKRPVVYQTIDGRRHEIDGRYVLRGRNRAGFAVGSYDRSRPLIIDPLLVYSFSFGGSSDERPTAIAVDSSGNAYITGTTKSTDFPTTIPFQSAAGGGVDSFVAKLNAAGTALVYATYIGGSGDDTANAIAIDSSGNAYVAGGTTSSNFPTAAALYTALKGSGDAFVLKLSANGGSLIYSTYLGGTSDDDARSIAVDGSGNAYVGGTTSSTNFPVANALKATNGYQNGFITKINPTGSALVFSTYIGGSGLDELNAIALDSSNNIYFAGKATSPDVPLINPAQSTGAGGLYRSSDGGATWSISNTGLKNWAYRVTIDRNNPMNMYAGTNGKGIYRSTDGGQTWLTTSQTADTIYEVVIDPTNSATVYARGSSIYKSTNSGATFTGLFSGGAPFFPSALVIDPTNSQTLYAGVFNGVTKSTDGGANWTLLSTGLSGSVQTLAIDPANPQTLYAVTSSSFFKSTNGGASWSDVSGGLSMGFNIQEGNRIVVDPVNTATVYVGVAFQGLFKTTNGGVSWTTLTAAPFGQFAGLAGAPSDPTILYASLRGNGLYKSTDSGATWALVGFAGVQTEGVTVHPTTSATVFLGGSNSDAFAGRLNAAGTALDYSSYLGGQANDFATAITVDSSGNATIVGDTTSADFPTLNPIQAAYGGSTDAFVVKLTSTGARSFATFIGGSGTDNSRAVALDSSGDIVLVGKTSSTDFPTLNPLQGEGAGFLRQTVDSGASWQARSRGLPSRPGSLAVQPTNSDYLLAGTFNGVYISSDGGFHWAQSNTNLGGVGIPALIFDPATLTTAYAGTTGGVFKSTDSGATWTATNNGLTNTDVHYLAIGTSSTTTSVSTSSSTSTFGQPVTFTANVSASDSGTILYAGTNTAGIFKSTDGAATWTAASNGLTNLAIRGIAVHPTSPSTVFAATGGGIFKTTDVGNTWTASGSGITNNDAYDVAIDPFDPLRMYAATAGGVFTSSDGGATWSAANSGLLDLDLRSMLLSANAANLYVAARSRLFRSSDGARTWVKSGLDGALPQLLAVDPVFPDVAYAASSQTAEGFIVKIGADGALIASTYAGGSGRNDLTAVGIASGGIITAGRSNSTDFPTTAAVTAAASPRPVTALGESPGSTPPPQPTYDEARLIQIALNSQFDLTVDFTLPKLVFVGTEYTLSFTVQNKLKTCDNLQGFAVPAGLSVTLEGYGDFQKGTFNTAVTAQGTCTISHGLYGPSAYARENVTCELGTISAGGSVQVNVTVTPAAPPYPPPSYRLETFEVEAVAFEHYPYLENSDCFRDNKRYMKTTLGRGVSSTTTTVRSSSPTSTFGQPVPSIANVTGTVRFMDGSSTLGTGTLSNNAASFVTSSLSAGTHSITAVYGGDSTYSGSSSAAITQTVNKASTTTTLASSANPSKPGDAVTFTATVSPSTATGSVTFLDGSTTLGTATLTNGSASFTTSSLSTATHSITASYSGDANYLASTSAALQQSVTTSPHGDANGDNQVTVSDIFYLINYLFAGGNAPVGLADVNGDGQVTVADIFYLINYLFAGGPPPK